MLISQEFALHFMKRTIDLALCLIAGPDNYEPRGTMQKNASTFHAQRDPYN